MSVFELKRRLHFAIHATEDEQLLQALLSLTETSSVEQEQGKRLQPDSERTKDSMPGCAKTNPLAECRISLKDRYYFEDRAF